MNMNLMEICKAYELPVEGTCGEWLFVPLVNAISSNHLDERSDDEEAMLAEAFNVRESSRLGCQINITLN